MENKKFKFIISIIIIIATIFRVFVIENTPLNDSTQVDAEMGMPKTVEDYNELYNLDNYDKEDVGHFYYIMYLYTNHELNDNTKGQQYHPPIHYILSATWLSFLDNFSLNSMQKIEGLQYLGLVYFFISVILVYKLLEKIKLSNKAKILIMLLYCFHPKLVEMTYYITNDFLVYIFEILSLLLLLNWNENSSFKNAIVLAITLGLGTLTKINCVVMVVPVGICYILKFVNNLKEKKDNSLLVLQGIFFWIIFLFLGSSYILRCMILHGEYYIPIPLQELYIGDASFFEIWGIKLNEIIFLNNHQTQNVWSGFVFTSLISKATDFRTVIGILNFVLMFYSCIAIFKKIKKQEKNENIFFITLISQMIAFVLYNAKNPFTCTWNSRYVLIAILLGLVYIGNFYDLHNNKILQKSTYAVSILFCFTSILSFFL